ncbi:LytR C-terminal domain-containing protein [Haematomicrobium sanguinis]|uniref:LytR C-terminal domain-containing protein n=1 Tax=Haematomicrobium sanguinis TaxID=479106 RepID=UPI00047BB2AA|nr:LytR C-terminal domain-containing protein [Haematomicrobium sanguinis]
MARETDGSQQEWNGHHVVSGDDLEYVFEDEDLVEDADERTRRSRKRRHTAVLLGLVVLIVAAVWFAWMVGNGTIRIGQPAQAGNDAPPPCPTETLDYPQKLDSFLVGIYNGTSRNGLAADVAEQMKQRGFAIGAVTNGKLTQKNLVAAVISGPSGRANALAVQAQIPGSDYFEDDRPEATVGVILGNKFEGLQDPKKVVAEAGTLQCPRFENSDVKPTDAP